MSATTYSDATSRTVASGPSSADSTSAAAVMSSAGACGASLIAWKCHALSESSGGMSNGESRDESQALTVSVLARKSSPEILPSRLSCAATSPYLFAKRFTLTPPKAV
jgi:hypothetical protein